MLTLQQICQATGGKQIGGSTAAIIHSFHFDTRLLSANSLFVALTSGERDGHLFLKEAAEAGAVAALISKKEYIKEETNLSYILVEDTQKSFADIARYYRNMLSIPIIAVTGSNGKTTTKDMIAHVLGKAKKVFKTYKNYNNHLGVPLSILQIEPDHVMAVLEMGMNHSGEIDFLASIARPDVSVITNVTDAHIEFFGTRENIAKAKAELLPYTAKSGFAILNGDNPYVVGVSHLNPGETYFYRIDQEADIFATGIRFHEKGTSFIVHVGRDSLECTMPMFGAHNVSNVLPAIFIAYKYGLDLADIAKSLSDLSITPMRFELVQHNGESIFINDAYNASPTSMKGSIKTFTEILPDRKKILVLGDMFELGEESDHFHQEVGEYIHSTAASFERIITVGDKSQWISAKASLPCQHFTNKKDAAEYLSQFLDATHAFLFKASRGMKLEQLVNQLITFETFDLKDRNK